MFGSTVSIGENPLDAGAELYRARSHVCFEPGANGRPARIAPGVFSAGTYGSQYAAQRIAAQQTETETADASGVVEDAAVEATVDITTRATSSSTHKQLKAAAARVRAARKLASRLADEKQAASMSPEAADRARVKAERAAEESARAEVDERSVLLEEGAEKWHRLQQENSALYSLLQELSTENQEAEERLLRLRQMFSDLHERAEVTGTKVVKAEVTPEVIEPTASEDEIAKLYTAMAVAQAVQRAGPPEVLEQAAPPAPPEDLVPEVPPVPPPEAPPAPPSAPPSPPTTASMLPPSAPSMPPPMAASPPPPITTSIPPPAVQPELAPVLLPPEPEPEPEEPDLAATVAEALSRGDTLFTCPEGPVQAGRRVAIMYQKNNGPLAFETGPLHLKMGLNQWDEIVVHQMVRMSGLELRGADLWIAEVDLPALLYQVDLVVMNSSDTIVDNNMGSDFHIKVVGGPTPEELVERRVEMLEEFEQQRLQMFAELEEHRMVAAVQEGRAAGDQARLLFLEQRDAERRMMAAEVVEERRSLLRELPNVAISPNAARWVGGMPVAGNSARLAYNRNSGPLREHPGGLKLHCGYDNWWQQDKEVVEMTPLDPAAAPDLTIRQEDNWWTAVVSVPSTAAVIDFVVSDIDQRVWDNNGGKDFHTTVVGALTEKDLIKMAEHELLQDSQAADEAGSSAAAQRALDQAIVKARTLHRRHATRGYYLFTQPLEPQAGRSVDIFYNPDRTMLAGRPDIFVRGSWNRWSHPRCFTPCHMKSVLAIPGSVGFLKATVEIPEDAYMLDLVFSDSGDMHGGFEDNNHGLDYHIPVVGGNGTERTLSVVHVAVEMAPIAKVGGMGDVVTALAKAVQQEGHEVLAMLPKYDCIEYGAVVGLAQVASFHWSGSLIKVWEGYVESVRTLFLEPDNGMFWVGCIYGRNDDAARFKFFCGAACEYMKIGNIRADIVHCHDWQTAPVASMRLNHAKAVFTIHNLNYGVDLVGRAMADCAVATTVSPTYAGEVSGHSAVAPNLSKLYGIRNGIDTDFWDPLHDRLLPLNYTSRTLPEGKAAARSELRRRMNLVPSDAPILGVVTRLTHQKGIHLMKHAAWRVLERGGQFVLLGSAPDPAVQAEFVRLAEDLTRQYHDRAKLFFSYDEPLSHLIYAGCDMLLVPSMFEPCGLTQMIAMRYGTVPIVRRTGGLNDTVFDVDHDVQRAAAAGLTVNGYNFEGADNAALDSALHRALSRWYSDRDGWCQLARSVMDMDWSWNVPAMDYVQLYHKALKH